jgi:hypothetical protein
MHPAYKSRAARGLEDSGFGLGRLRIRVGGFRADCIRRYMGGVMWWNRDEVRSWCVA